MASLEDIKTIGVIGAGQMGNGIAHVIALAGYDVRILDISQDALDKAIGVMEKNMDRQVKKEIITAAQKDAALKLISTGTEYTFLSDCDLVIEAATENEEIKKQIFKALCPVLGPEAIIATNTSSISVTRLASYTDRPAKFMGMHFMNPVPLMKLVELIRGIATDETTYRTIHELTKKLGKDTASAEDFPAFIVNRILLPMINEAWGMSSPSIQRCVWVRTIRWARCSWQTLLVSIPACRSCMSCMMVWPIPNIARARFWSNMSKPDGLAARLAVASMTIAATNRPRPAKRLHAKAGVTTSKPLPRSGFFCCIPCFNHLE